MITIVSDSLAAVTVTVYEYDLLKRSKKSPIPIVLSIQVAFAS